MEVYGKKPKRFTKAWWEYFWEYYKWHTVSAVVAAVLIAVTCVQCATKIKYDIQVDFISEFGLLTEQEDALEALAAGCAEDITGNGISEAYVMNLNMNDSGGAEMSQAMQTKLMVEMGYSEGYAFIMTKKYADLLTEENVLSPTAEWAEEYANDGCVISLSDCTALYDISINAEEQDLYIGVTALRSKDKDDKREIARHENGIRFARYLIRQR